MDATALPDRRCVVVVAAAGYGKTSTVAAAAGADAAWHHATLDPALLDGPAPLVVFDDADLDDTGAVRALLEAAGRLPPGRTAVLVARLPPGFSLARWRGRGTLAELGPAELALSADAVAEALAARGLPADTATAAELHDLTAGWPALVQLSADVLATAPPGALTERLLAADGPVVEYVLGEVMPGLPDAARRLLRDAAHLDGLPIGLAEELGHRTPGATMTLLTRIGLATTGEDRQCRPVPLVAGALTRHRPIRADRARRLWSAAARWNRDRGRHLAAAVAAERAGDHAACAAILAEHGPELITGGGVRTYIDLVESTGVDDPAVLLSHGEALSVVGRHADGVTVLRALAAGRTTLPAGLAWRLGAAHYHQGEFRASLAALDAAEPGGHPNDRAHCLAWSATVHWKLGDTERCGELAARARELAAPGGSSRALVTAHIALALHAVLTGDRPENLAAYETGLQHAAAIGDLVQAARIRANRSGMYLEEARLSDALDEAQEAVGLCTRAGHETLLPVALCNRAETFARLGRLDEALDSYQGALACYQKMGSRKASYPLHGIGMVHRWQRRDNQARAAYEEAIRTSEVEADVQGLVPALAGLARVLVHTDPDAAQAAALRAVSLAGGRIGIEAAIALGHVTLTGGDRDGAVKAAQEAAATARRHRDWVGLAEALELEAAAVPDPSAARVALREAASIWRRAGALPAAEKADARLGALPGATADERAAAGLARIRIASTGHPGHEWPAHTDAPAAAIQTLGGFAVVVGGEIVPPAAWQSRKARDLLRILVARRGRPVPREELAELLWPGEDAGKVAHRLSVALSILRKVLDGGRGRHTAAEVIRADAARVALDRTRTDLVEVDVYTFLDGAGYALRAQAVPALSTVERSYTGDFLEDEPYEDWSVSLREEARAVYLRVLRALSDLAERDAVGYLHRLLDKDPYDMRAHRDLVARLTRAGALGEARRAEERHAAALRALGR
ncbi:DNA-binding SARP family transcriptional activator [Phytomonospora endophytica]|uniref:DNA-binding SARP family transcriptional activator n=2 Tax=Phytomonospora endophytica TaxID=714109 RepID=A0A841FYN9_9ACTN|nr:DNA-binding SARP family transcriptional activator [Phytomonospora endophytica]